MAFLTREEILAVRDLDIEGIPGPCGVGEVGIRILTGTERDWLVEQFTLAQEESGGQVKQFHSLVCTLAFCDEQGGRLFTTNEVAALGEKSALWLQTASQKILRKNKLDNADVGVEEKKESGALSDVFGSSLLEP